MPATRKQSYLLAAALLGLASQGLQAQFTSPKYPGFVGQDVGAPQIAGSMSVANTNINGTTYTNAIFITGGGHDIWDSSDDFFYFYTNKTHGFDARVQVLNLVQPSSTWAKAELMVRAPQDPSNPAPDGGDPEVNNMTTTVAGQNAVMDQWRATRGGGSSWPGSFTALNSAVFAPQYPNCWLRFQRVGDVFISSASHDGTNWTVLDKYDTSANPLGDTVLVGLAVTSHDQATTANAAFANLQFVTPPPDILNILPRNRTSYLSPNTNLTFTVNSVGGVNPTGISLVVNGVDKTAGLQISGTPNSQNVTYAGPFQQNAFYSFTVKAVDLTGMASTATFAWDTLSDTNYTIEGEDFNFGGGQFIDNPVLASTAGPNNYIDRAGVPYVDEYDPTEGGANHAYRAYDSSTATGEVVGTEPNGDVVRSAFAKAQQTDAAIVDYDVGWVDVGEWWNYTRTFATGKYKIYARLAYPGASFAARFDQVVSSSTTSNQVTSYLGSFAGPGTGGWQTYAFYPLQDYLGTPVVLKLGGVTTLRFTTIAGGLNANFYMFVPYLGTETLTPYISTVTPGPSATGVNPAAVISATVINRDTGLNTANVSMTVNGASVTPTVTPNTAGAIISYAAPSLYALGSTNTVQLVLSDNAATPNKQTNQWSFVVISPNQVPFTMPTAWAKPANSGQTPGWSVRVIQENQSGNQNNTLDWMEGILAGAYAPVAQGLDNPAVINYKGAGGSGDFGNDEPFDSTFGLVGANNFAMEAITYVALGPGVYTFGANTDDGFRMTTGNYAHDMVNMPGAEFNGGRGPADTTWKFLVMTNGLYPFRLAYEEGGGGYECEVWSVDDNGTRHLIGDPNDPNALKAYRFSSALPTSPVNVTQQPGNVSVEAGTPLTLTVGANSSVASTFAMLFEWTLNGNHLAYGPSFTLPYAATADAGTYNCTITLLGYQTSQTTVKSTVTVTARTDPPTVANVLAYSNTVSIQFSEPVDATSAGVVGNYGLSGGLNVTAAALDPNDASGATVLLTTAVQAAGTQYTLTINGVKDAAGNLIAANTTAKVSSGYANITANAPESDATGHDWDLVGFWSDGNPASVSSVAEPGVTYELLPGSRMRSSYTVTNAVFPGATLLVDGSGTYRNNPNGTEATAEIRFKNQNGWSIYFTNLVMNGGQLDVGNTVNTIILGKVTIAKDTAMDGGGGAGNDRGYTIGAQLVGTGTITYFHDSSMLPRTANSQVLDLNITGTSNTFSGKWNIVVGALVGGAPGALGTNDLNIGASGILETLYDLNNPSGALYLSGQMYLHQNDTFRAVWVGDTALTPGTYTFAQLNTAYPGNFPASWAAVNGSTNTTGSGSIKVLGNAAPPPTGPRLTIAKSGSNVLISFPTADGAGFTLQSASNLTKPITWAPVSQTATTSGGTSTVTIPIGAGTQYYQMTK